MKKPSWKSVELCNPLKIREQGVYADSILTEAGLVLTQGGEPTFVPFMPEGMEWSIGAIGPRKLPMAREMAAWLAREKFEGCMVLLSSGKLYPGEALPRWKLGLYHYPGHGPVWNDLRLILLDQENVAACLATEARQLGQALAGNLGLAKGCLTAHEDVGEKMRLAAGNGLPSPWPVFNPATGEFALPDISLQDRRSWEEQCEAKAWIIPVICENDAFRCISWPENPSGSWVLFPGDSPAGLRLPLHQLPDTVSKTAITVEVKSGELWIFLPPCPSGKAFRSLLNVVETTLAGSNLPPAVIWGYAPPDEKGLIHLGLTADPGVLEVNLPPAGNWLQLEDTLKTVYQAAGEVGLRGLKYHHSGRAVASGGGGHILFGGASLATNPFILQPRILSGLIRFFQHHPSLSYAFSGLFTGPSSQAPRIDESVFEAPYEMEIALGALDSMATPGDPAVMDSILRNLMLDWNGNTHRAEISVDKFYSLAPSGRLGLVELRGFEMQPDVSMALCLNAFLRCVIASFSVKPFQEPLIEWGKDLHDRFSLPWFLQKDLGDVCRYLSQFGFGFREEWFQPCIDFRFPEIHAFHSGAMRFNLRQAVEPWPVMGEAMDSSGTTSRTVDASTDRIQCLLEYSGPEESFPFLTVNDVPLTMRRVDPGFYLAGVRYRLFDNVHGLQPHIKSHSPLTFRFFASEKGPFLGGVRFYNWKKDSGGYEGIPSDHLEAQRRVDERIERLSPAERMAPKFSSGTDPLPDAERYVLDLRKHT